MSALPVLLVVDDEPDLRRMLDIHLRREGFEVVLAASGTEGLATIARRRPDLVILDLMLPDLSGTEFCRRIREREATAGIPILMLTAKGEEIDRVVGFEVGADDYVVKSSFSLRELTLRVRALLRRRGAQEDAAAPSRLGRLVVDVEAHRASVDGHELDLTATEFRLLACFAARPGRMWTRGALLQEVWEMSPDIPTRTVDTHVKRLREKLGPVAEWIETARGVGYKFVPRAV